MLPSLLLANNFIYYLVLKSIAEILKNKDEVVNLPCGFVSYQEKDYKRCD